MPDKTLNDQIIEAMFSLSRIMKDEMTFDSETSQLTLLQIQALIFIKRKESATMSEIANHFNISLSTATALSDKLVYAHLIERQNDEKDRRLVKIVLTEKGTSLLMEAMKQRQLKISKMLSYLEKDEKQQLLDIMQNLLTNIQQNHE